MDAIWTKVKADLTSQTLTLALIVVTIIAASALLTLALATLLNLSAPYDRSFKELNAAHLWLYFDRDLIRARDIERIEALPCVVQSTGLRYSVDNPVRIGDTRVWTSLRVTPLAPPQVNRLLVQQGRTLEPGLEILAAKDLQDLYDLTIGDEIQITGTDGQKVNLPVIGLAYNPMWDTYRNSQPPYLYVSEETLRTLFPDQTTWNWSAGVRLRDPQEVDQALAQIEALLRRDAVVGHTDWRDVKRSALFGAKLNFVFLGAFSVFAILATVFVVTSNISATILAQFRQIGILKAVGFTQQQILMLYVGRYLLLGVIGSPLGLLIGILLSPLPLKSVAASLSTTFKPPANLILIGIVLTAIPATVILATLGSAYQGAKANIIRAIAVGGEPPQRRQAWPVRLAERLRLPMVFQLGLNDVFAKPFRSLLTGLNLMLGVIGIVFGLTLNETLDEYRQHPSLLGIVYDAKVTRVRTSDTRARGLLRRAPGVTAFYGESLIKAETEDGQTFQVRAVEGELSAFPFQVSQGRFFEPGTYEAIAGQGLLDWLGLQVGDELTLYLQDKVYRPTTWRIVGQYTEPVNVGQMMMTSLSTVERSQKETEPKAYYLKFSPDIDIGQLKRYLVPNPDADLNLVITDQAIPSVVIYLQLAIFVLAAILIGIALVNVFNSSLLAVQERVRVIGVLKTIGMTPAQALAMINTTAGVLGFVASMLGIPLGLLFTSTVLANLAKTYGFGQVQVTLSPIYVLLLPPVMVGISILGSWLPGRRAAQLDIVSVLRSE